MLEEIVHLASQYMDHKRKSSSCQLLIKLLSTGKMNFGGNKTTF
jgi:hypothetical protein